jgi:hypothetical protein
MAKMRCSNVDWVLLNNDRAYLRTYQWPSKSAQAATCIREVPVSNAWRYNGCPGLPQFLQSCRVGISN